ncbi:MAG: SDR family NAD(P)-dependent oxidoreductase, partial [Ekhidna sp.]|nr:SDR family NAD(P)-dependent oxidoreductase [Ekhidna sp.]
MLSLNHKYPNKTAFITGAASGLGAAFSSILNKNGWKLHLSDVNLDILGNFRDTLENPEQTHIYQLDVSDKLSYETISDKIGKNIQQLDLLINNAGVGDGELFQEYKMDHWERMIRINLLGTYYGCHYMLPLIEKQKGT